MFFPPRIIVTRGKSYGRDRRYYTKRNDWGSCLLTRVSGVYRQRIRGGSPSSSMHTVTNAQPKVCGNKYNGRHERGMLLYSIRGLEWKERKKERKLRCRNVPVYLVFELLFHFARPVRIGKDVIGWIHLDYVAHRTGRWFMITVPMALNSYRGWGAPKKLDRRRINTRPQRLQYFPMSVLVLNEG